MNYSFDIEKFCESLLPSFLKLPRLVAFLNIFITPLKTLYSSFLIEGNMIMSEARFIPQTGKLEALLNTRFDSKEKRIKIVHSIDYSVTLSDTNPVTLSDTSPVTLFDKSIMDGVDFHVEVPHDFVKGYAVTLNSRFEGAKPVTLSDVVPVTLSDVVPVTLSDKLEGTKPVTLNDTNPVTLFDLNHVDNINQINEIIIKHKLPGKIFKLNTNG